MSGGRVDLELVRKAEPEFKEAEAGAGLAIASLSARRSLLLPQVSEARSDLLETLVQTRSGLSKAATSAEILPALLGESGPRTWFIAVQNSAEMRGTGGFIGGFGILRTESGQASLVRMDPDRRLPLVKTPVAAAEEVALRYDRFAARTSWQNVNMTPDFPTAARMISAMWEQSTGERIDGVMAVDAAGLARIVELVGPVEIPEIGRVVDSTNLVEVILKDAYSLIPNRSERQDVLVSVGRQAFTRLFSNEFRDPRLFAKTIGSALTQKHLLIWTEDQADALAKLGVDGALRPADGSDYLMVVGQNAAANKLDYYASQEVAYDVDLTAPGLLTGKLRIESTNAAPLSGLPAYVVGPEGPASPHRSYLSVYLPGTSDGRLVQINGDDATVESHREAGLAVLSQFVEIPSGETSSLELGVVGRHEGSGEYRLVARKQPKITSDRLRVRIRLPEGAVVSDATEGMVIADGVATWSGELSTDKEFIVKYEIEERSLMGAFKKAIAAFNF